MGARFCDLIDVELWLLRLVYSSTLISLSPSLSCSLSLSLSCSLSLSLLHFSHLILYCSIVSHIAHTPQSFHSDHISVTMISFMRNPITISHWHHEQHNWNFSWECEKTSQKMCRTSGFVTGHQSNHWHFLLRTHSTHLTIEDKRRTGVRNGGEQWQRERGIRSEIKLCILLLAYISKRSLFGLFLARNVRRSSHVLVVITTGNFYLYIRNVWYTFLG